MIPKNLVSQAIRNPSEFKILFGGGGLKPAYLYQAAKSYPEYSDILIKMSYEDLENYRCIYVCLYDLYITTKHFPDHASNMIKIVEMDLLKALDHAGYFGLFVKDVRDLYCLIKLLPNFNVKITEFVIGNEILRRHLVEQSNDIYHLAKVFPDLAEKQLLSSLSNRGAFERLINCCWSFCKAAELFPSHEGKLINAVLIDPDHFSLIFKTVDDLKEISTRFPKYAYILDKSSVEEAAASAACYVKSLGEIKKASFFMSYANKTKSTFLENLPGELQIKIAGLCGDPAVHDEEKSENIASYILGCQRY